MIVQVFGMGMNNYEQLETSRAEIVDWGSLFLTDKLYQYVRSGEVKSDLPSYSLAHHMICSSLSTTI